MNFTLLKLLFKTKRSSERQKLTGAKLQGKHLTEKMNTKDKSLLLTTYKDSLDNNKKKSNSPRERVRKVTKRKFFKKPRK